MVEETWQDGFSAFFNITWQQTTATARAHNLISSALGVENFSRPQARFRKGYRKIPHDSHKTSEMSNAKLFNDVETMSKHSDDENVSTTTNLNLYRTLNLTILNAFPGNCILICRWSSRYDVYNSRYRLSKLSYFNTLVDCTLRLLPNDERLA